MIEQGIRTKILALTGMSALVGTRMSEIILLQGGALPAIRYTKIDGAPDKTLEGPSALKHARFQFDCLSSVSLSQAKSVAKIINGGFNGFRGAVTGGHIRRASALDDGSDMSEPDLGLFIIQLDYSVWFKED